VFALAIAAMAVSPPLSKLQSWVRAEMASRHIPGMAVGVFRSGKPVEIVTAGYADLENKVKVRRQTQFEICSITKQFTAAAVLLLVQDGKMRLDDPVSRYIEGVPADWSGVTIRRLLDHTSGVPDKIFSDHLTSLPQHEAIAKLVSHPLEFQPGERWSYNNTGYWLAGLAIEKASGKPFFDFLNERIFKPLRMKHTFPNRSTLLVPWRARGYDFKNGAFHNAQPLTDVVGNAAGGLISTIDDLNIWSQALVKGKLLSAASRREMLTPALLNDGETAWNFAGGGYGLGVFVRRENAKTIEKHSGGWDDASCQLTRFLDDELTVVVLTNVGHYDARSFVGEVIGRLFDPSIFLPRWKSSGEKDPPCTAAVKQIVSHVAAGESVGDLCTPVCRASILSSIKDLHRLMQGEPMRDFRFLQSIKQDRSRIYLFEATFRDRLIIQATVDQDGKVAGFDLLQPPSD